MTKENNKKIVNIEGIKEDLCAECLHENATYSIWGKCKHATLHKPQISPDTGLPDKPEWEEVIRRHFKSIYYGKDIYGEPNYVPENAIDDFIKIFSQTLEDEMIKYQKELLKDYKKDIDEARKETWQDASGKILAQIKDLKEKGYEATNILESIENELMFGDL